MRTHNWLVRVLFLGAFGLMALAVLEKIVNLAGYTILRVYAPSRLSEYTVVVLLFAIALILRDIRHTSAPKS